jgi:hypothetical protein
VAANYEGTNATMKPDDYWFTLVNFEHVIPLATQSFAFPMHVE